MADTRSELSRSVAIHYLADWKWWRQSQEAGALTCLKQRIWDIEPHVLEQLYLQVVELL